MAPPLGHPLLTQAPTHLPQPRDKQYNTPMAWEVEYTDEFEDWWLELSESQQDSIESSVNLLIERGPRLAYPYSSSVLRSRHGRMRELRVQSGGRPIRIFYAFDPRRMAILLIGGDKTGDDRFYEVYVPIADNLYHIYLQELLNEGLIQ